MLLEFRASNYKSFKEEFVFSMIPAPKQKGLDYSVLKETINKKEYKGLSSAVIYGPNASGKTNIIGAMDTFKAIVMRGNIKNTDVFLTPNMASYTMEMVPFCDFSHSPVSFSVLFIEGGMLISYSLVIDIGTFLDGKYKRRILSEKLEINNNTVFARDDKLTVVPTKELRLNMFNEGIIEKWESAVEIARSGMNAEELFLTGGFKNIFSRELSDLVFSWFEKSFIVIYKSDSIRSTRQFADPKSGAIYVEKTLTEAVKPFGITGNTLAYRVMPGDSADVVLCSIIGNKKKAVIPSSTFESYGTLRFINEFPLIIRALSTGATLVMDEFDASIHPLALMNIISVFHNDEINKKKAQLIFNTHNPIFLNAEIFRRDEIKFVERDENTGVSTHYSLSDFKTGGENSTRKGEDYMKNYFINKYGAIKDVDFSDILDRIVNGEGN